MAQAGSTPDPDAQMASARDDDTNMVTPNGNASDDDSNSDNPISDDPESSVPAEERSPSKLSQISNFADKYHLQFDPKTITPASLNLEHLDLDFIQVSVQAPPLQKTDDKGNKLSKDKAKRLQLAQHEVQIRLARQGIIREELRAILRSPDFNFTNSNPKDLVPASTSQPVSQSQNDNDEKEFITPLVPTPNEPPNMFLNPTFPDNLPKDFDRAIFRNLFIKYPIRLSGDNTVYFNSISARIRALRELLNNYTEFNKDIRKQDNGNSLSDTSRSIINLNNAYITVANHNLHFYKSLRSQFDASPDIKVSKSKPASSSKSKPNSTQTKAKSKSKNPGKPHNANNSSRRPPPPRTRSRSNKSSNNISNNNNGNNNNNNNNNNNYSDLGSNPSDPNDNIPAHAAATESEFNNNKDKYAGVAGKDSARRTCLLQAAVAAQREKQSVCVLCVLFATHVCVIPYFRPFFSRFYFLCFRPCFSFFRYCLPFFIFLFLFFVFSLLF